METQSKPKIANTNSVEEDFISRLPDEILTHILSFIDTKSSVATTILSKRWNGVWISVPNLDFGTYRPYDSDDMVTKSHFENFLDHVLSLNNVVSVRNIFLEIWAFIESDRLNLWLLSIGKRNAEKIQLSLHHAQVYCLPDTFFNQKNLVELDFPKFNTTVPQTVCFPRLTTLRLHRFRLNGGDSLKNLMSGCSVLTDLYLDIVALDGTCSLNICSPTLRVLELRIQPIDEYFLKNVVIDAPIVTHLTLMDRYETSYDIHDVFSLVNVSLNVLLDGKTSLILLLSKISHASELFWAIPSSIISLEPPIFHNLKKLTLSISLKKHWPCLFRLFHSTPNLLACVILVKKYRPAPCSWDEPIEVPHCFLSCLVSVTIPVNLEKGRHKRDEMQMISYILKNALVLKKLSIECVSNPDVEQENEFLETLLTLPKSSVACQVCYLS